MFLLLYDIGSYTSVKILYYTLVALFSFYTSFFILLILYIHNQMTFSKLSYHPLIFVFWVLFSIYLVFLNHSSVVLLYLYYVINKKVTQYLDQLFYYISEECDIYHFYFCHRSLNYNICSNFFCYQNFQY